MPKMILTTTDDALPSAELLGGLFGEHSEFQSIRQ